tara:strand:+ start:283 stop:525 length:243 start_codon:yes stop_codon:yes gene_type:complete
LFDWRGNFHGAYSSATAAHRDALKICNKGLGRVTMETREGPMMPTATLLRNAFKGAFDVQVVYSGAPGHQAKIIKTKLRE